MTKRQHPGENCPGVGSKQQHVEELLEQAIQEGRWKLFEKLPPERTLAGEFLVARNTLRAALSALIGRGVLRREPGGACSVREMPVAGLAALTANIQASIIIMPPLARAVSTVIKPSQIMNLERLFPLAGAALRNDDIRGFVHAQERFFTDAAAVLNNQSLCQAVGACLPGGRAMTRILCARGLQQNEMLFACLARVLSAMRHANADEAQAACEAYFMFLDAMTGKK